MRILLDYRPALRAPTGVGAYVHLLAQALARTGEDQISALSTSWKDRPLAESVAELRGVRVVDRQIPVRALMWSWNRLGWPPVEWLSGPADVVHAQSPLIIPTRAAASVITIHDLDFLHHPERAQGEARRDFVSQVKSHAHRADQIIVSSRYAEREVCRHLQVPQERVSVCPPGYPAWADNVAHARAHRPTSSTGSILFVGTLTPRKNVATLLDAYELMRQRDPGAPPLWLVGGVTAAASSDLERLRRASLHPHVQVTGYVDAARQRQFYEEARLLVLPSWEEGFGLPVLEAMACGVPVVVSNRGALPEVVGDAATPLEPSDVEGFAAAMARLLEPRAAATAAAAGRARAAAFSWDRTAMLAREAYRAALQRRDSAQARRERP